MKHWKCVYRIRCGKKPRGGWGNVSKCLELEQMARFELLVLFFIYIILRRARGRQLKRVMCAMRSSSTETTQDSNTAMLPGATAHRSAQQRNKSHCR